MNTRTATERVLDAFLAPEADRLADRVIDAALADIARTPQRRALRVPWRFPDMPALTRATGIAAVALVAVVGAGGLIYLNSAVNTGGEPTPSPTAAPTAGPAPTASTAGWMSHTSAIYGFDMQYPEGWSSIPASRAWESDDRFPADDLAYADVFLTPEQDDDQIALFVWEMPPGDGADLESFPGLIAWAERFCADFGMPSCEGSSEVAEVMCHNPCSPAILVPTPDWQVAFFEDETSKLIGPTVVRVILVARPDRFPTAARYGGSVQLLKSVLTTMDVWEVGQAPPG